MRQWLAPLLLLASAQAAPDALTLEEAKSLSPDALAHRVLGMAAGLVREATVQSGTAMFSDLDQLRSATFATAPRASWPGLCSADLYQVTFTPVSPNTARGAGLATVTDLTRETVFRTVDAGPAPAGYSKGYNERLSKACAGQTPVLPAPAATSFFHSDYDERPDGNGVAAQLAAALMRRLGALAVAPRCESWIPGSIAVGDCRRALADFADGPLFQVDVKPCPAPSPLWCAELRDRDGLNWKQVTVRIVRPVDPFKPAAIRAVTLQDIRAVE